MPIIKAVVFLLVLQPSWLWAANADDFFCRTTYCVIPYDGQGIQNGVEVCYADVEKKEKAKEVTWKNGLRQGPARCFEKGKIKIEAHFEKNRLHGLYVERDYDSTGDHYMRVVNGRQEGFAFSIDKEKKMNFRGCWRDGAMSELAEKDCLKGDYGPYTKQVFAEFKALKDTEKLIEAEEKARRNGPQIEKFPDGSVRAQYKNKDGQTIGTYKEFHRNGKTAAERSYSNEGKLDGEAKEWNDQGVLKRRTVYKAGIKTSETEFRDNGQPHLFVIWEGEGFDRSPCLTYYYESGKKQSSECRLPSLNWYEPLHGEYVYWADDGKELVKGQYDRGARAGTWKYFYGPGARLSQEQVFENGALIRSVEYNGSSKTLREFHPDGSLKSEKKSTVGGA